MKRIKKTFAERVIREWSDLWVLMESIRKARPIDEKYSISQKSREGVKESKVPTYTEYRTVEKPIIEWLQELGWEYKPAEEIPRTLEEAFDHSTLRKALKRLNNGVLESGGDVESVIAKLERLPNDITGNKEFLEWLKGERSIVLKPGEKSKTIRLIDYENIENNTFVVTNQFKFSGYENIRFDILLMVNGIPLVTMEAKKPTGRYDYTEAIHQIQRYNRDAPQIFKYLAFVCATEGINFKYDWVYPNSIFSYWRNPDLSDPIKGAVKGLFRHEQFLDLVQNYIVFERDKDEIKKKIARYQQVSAANKIVKRVVGVIHELSAKKSPRTGLIWHTQGSGKTLTMLFAAWKLKKSEELKNPTILVVVDRRELENQTSGVFQNVDLPYTDVATSIRELSKKLRRDNRNVIITTLQKFGKIEDILNVRENIIIFIDEAHRSQYGSLAAHMRNTLPNALIFGFTGTPIDRGPMGRSTFNSFCPERERYLDRYSIKQSVDDGSTVPIYYLPRPVYYRDVQESLNKEFLDITSDLKEEEQERVLEKSARLREVLKARDRVEKVAKNIAKHFKDHVEPLGLKAQLVAVDREACALYKEELDKYLPGEWSKVVYTESQRDEEFLRKHYLKRDETVKKIAMDLFQKKDENPRILIVTDMLLTGFDAPIEQVMYLDKPLRDHRLLQAIARTNRPYPGKEGGIVVDYVGIFAKLKKALHFEDEDIEGVAFNFKDLKKLFEKTLSGIMSIFKGIKRDGSRNSLLKAIALLQDDEILKIFKEKLFKLRRLYETIAPDPFILQIERDFKWLNAVYEAFKKFTQRGEKPLEEYVDKTKKLVRESVEIFSVGKKIPIFKIDSDYLKKLEGLKYTKEHEKIELIGAIGGHITICIEKNPIYETLKEKLDRILKERDGRVVLQSLKDLVQEMVNIDKEEKEEKSRLGLSDEEYALMQILKKHDLDIGENESQFVKDILDGVEPETFKGWQSKRKVRQDVEKKFFDACLEQFTGRLEIREISKMAEEMTQFLVKAVKQ
jgi:type I restriction enzyme R subunit